MIWTDTEYFGLSTATAQPLSTAIATAIATARTLFDALKRGCLIASFSCFRNNWRLITCAAVFSVTFAAICLLFQPTWVMRLLQKCIPSVFFLKRTEEKVVALTIDDAPHGNLTLKIFEILQKHECTATFFAIGENFDKDPKLFKDICAAGHEVANHTMRDFPSWRLPLEELRKELSETDSRIKTVQGFSIDPATGKDLKWFRPGHGFVTKGMIAEAKAQGYRVALGSIYPWDTLFTAKGWLLSQYILWRIHPGAVIIVHDREPQKEQTLEILKTILPELKKRDYNVVTLSRLHLRKATKATT